MVRSISRVATIAVCVYIVLALGGLAWSVPSAHAVPIMVRARLSASDIYIGESVTLELRIQGVRAPELPVVRHPDMEITSEGGQPFSNSSMSMINGRTTRQEEFGYVAQYRLRPRRTGELTLAPIAVTYEGKTYRSQAVTLRVRQPAEQDYMNVRVSTEKPSYVLGETVTLTLELSLRKLTAHGKVLDLDPFFREQPPYLQIPWFETFEDWKTDEVETFVQPFVGQQRPGFAINDYYDQSSFFRTTRLAFTLPRQSTQRPTATGLAEYFTYTLRKSFQPLRTGVYTVPPVVVKAKLPTLIDARGRAQHTENVVASSSALRIEIRALPNADQVAHFYGAVGHFRLAATATPAVLKVGDPLTLSLTLTAEGDSLIETVRPPQLEEQPALMTDFKIPTDPPAVKTTQNTKTFTYTLRPRHAATRAVPPIAIAYFDPDTGRFHTLQSDAIPLRVEEATILPLSEIVVTSDHPPASAPPQALPDGILVNYTGNDVLVPQDAQLRLTPWLMLWFGGPPLCYGLAFCLQWYRKRRQLFPARQRARSAGKRALMALRELQRRQFSYHDTTVYDRLHQVLVTYIRDRLGLPGAGLTVDDVALHLQEQGIEPDLIDRVMELWQLCDSARYAPGAIAIAPWTELIANTTACIQRLERSWRS